MSELTPVLDARLFLEANVSDLTNSDRLCKFKNNLYVICQDYCCGELWETEPLFCCPTDFRPIRNLLYYLLSAFVALFTTIVLFLLVESGTKRHVMTKVALLGEIKRARSFSEWRTIDTVWDSSGTSLDEDSSIDGDESAISRKPRLQMLKKHSQSFKEMSKLKKQRRRKKNDHTQSS